MGSDKDRRILLQMRQSLASRGEGVEALGRLISELESLGSQLETPNESWRHRFHEQWGALEQVFAAALDRGASALDKEIAGDAVAQVEALVDEALG